MAPSHYTWRPGSNMEYMIVESWVNMEPRTFGPVIGYDRVRQIRDAMVRHYGYTGFSVVPCHPIPTVILAIVGVEQTTTTPETEC